VEALQGLTGYLVYDHIDVRAAISCPEAPIDKR
jgi:hypothetical protein